MLRNVLICGLSVHVLARLPFRSEIFNSIGLVIYCWRIVQYKNFKNNLYLKKNAYICQLN